MGLDMSLTLQQVARVLDGEVSGEQVRAPGPGHSRKDRSLSVKLDDNGEPIVHSFADDDNLKCKDYVRERCGLPPWQPRRGKARETIATYTYTDEAGQLLFEVIRYAPKDFRQRRLDGQGNSIWKLDDVRRVLYRFPELIEAVSNEHPIFIAEGEKAVDALIKLGVPATCSPHGAGKWRDEYSQHLKGAEVIILPDSDDPGESHAQAVLAALKEVAANIKVLRLPDLPSGGDAYDWIEAGGTAERLWELVATQGKEERPRLWPLDMSELLDLQIPPRGMLLDPVLPEKGLAMLYASRGVGKTFLSCGISFAVATGSDFLKWSAPKPRRVLHCDGEMPASELRERFKQAIAGQGRHPESGMLRILSADLIEAGIGNFADPKTQEELNAALDGVELLVLDNLSSLTSVIRDNDAESWNPLQEWFLRLRRRGVSVLIVHHAGKGGEQRGTSRREDVLDTSISLKRPSDYVATEGARFEVHLEKARGIHGEKAKPFEAKFEVHDDAALWTIREIEDVNAARVKALLNDDGKMSIRDIADETGLSKSSVGRIKKKIGDERRELDADIESARDTPWDKNL
jgi:hypothetical protein